MLATAQFSEDPVVVPAASDCMLQSMMVLMI